MLATANLLRRCGGTDHPATFRCKVEAGLHLSVASGGQRLTAHVVVVAQSVEHLVVVQGVAGSSPVIHPNSIRLKFPVKCEILGRMTVWLAFLLGVGHCFRTMKCSVRLPLGAARPGSVLHGKRDVGLRLGMKSTFVHYRDQNLVVI